MPSYWSSLLTTTTTRVATLRANLLPNENDGDTPDDTHICRVLRAYYTEKGRQFPAWLPPDPKAPPPVVIQPVLYAPTVGSSYGGLNQGSGGTALSSLWDSQPQSSTAPPLQGQPGRESPGIRPAAAARPNPFTRQQHPRSNSPQSQVMARPLPSQREGSYQSIGRGDPSPGPGSPAPGNSQYTSAKDRLRKLARPKAEAPRMADAVQQVVRNNSYGPSGPASIGNYEDRFAPPDSGYAGVRGNRSADKPFVAATSPWATTESEFGGGGYGYNSSTQSSATSGRPGLPNGPRDYGGSTNPRVRR